MTRPGFSRASGVIGTIVAIVVVAVAVPVATRANHAIPQMQFTGMVKRPDAQPRKRLELQFFTRYAHPGQTTITANKGRAEAIAQYAGRNENRRYGEWHIDRGSRDGRKLLGKLARKLRRQGRVRFTGSLLVSGATAPQPSDCTLRDFGRLGLCRGIIVPQRPATD
jgi:hypothetical protein